MITLDRLKEVLWLNRDDGRFYWNGKVRGVKLGTQAGSFDAHGYGQLRIDGKIYKEHHLVWLYVTGKWPDDQIDHHNHDRRDNRFENLRIVSNTENHRNRPMQNNNTSGFVGVSICKQTGKFEAYASVDGKKLRFGRFEKIEDAISARVEANAKYGFHKNHGLGRSHSKPSKQVISNELKP